MNLKLYKGVNDLGVYCFRMPEKSLENGAAATATTTNGSASAMAAALGDGHMEGKTGETFLFTSESVGEGHPGRPTLCSMTYFYPIPK